MIDVVFWCKSSGMTQVKQSQIIKFVLKKESQYIDIQLKIKVIVQNSILHELLKTITPREEKAFLDYAGSPYPGAKPEIAKLAKYLIGGEQAAWANKKAAFSAVFGANQPYDDARLRKTMEQLLRLLERFLVLEQQSMDSFEYRLRLAEMFAGRKQDKRFRRLAEMPLPFPAEETAWTTENFEQAGRWYQLIYDYRSHNQREHNPDLHRRITHCQTVALLARRLRSACIFRSNQKETAGWTPDPLLDWAVQAQLPPDIAALPLLQMLFAAYRALESPQETEHFVRLREGLLSAPTCFTLSERRELLLLGINFCSKRYNAGDTAWLDTQLELYDYGIREHLLLENGWITGYTFLNIGTLALIGRRYQWLGQFISDYRDKVEPRYRASASAFNQARLDYALKRYNAALEVLQQNLFDDVLLNLSAKTVQAKCFYELNEFDLLDTHLDAMRKYVHRHKEVGYYGERYLNFIAALRRIMRASVPRSVELRAEISAMPVLAEKEWLMEWVKG